LTVHSVFETSIQEIEIRGGSLFIRLKSGATVADDWNAWDENNRRVIAEFRANRG